MRTLIIIPSRRIVRDFVASGAFRSLEESDTWYVSPAFPGSDVAEEALFPAGSHYIGPVPVDHGRKRAYIEIRTLLQTSYRFRSRTARMKLQELPRAARWRAKLEAAPGVRQAKIARRLRAAGPNPVMDEVIRRVNPQIVIAVTRGPTGEVLVMDATRVARELGIPVLTLTYNWDNLSSKSAFAFKPDFLGAIGHQSAEHATSIHRIPKDRVRVLGSPYIDDHFRTPPARTNSPYPFPYVLFAGCYRPFDEKRSLELLERTIEHRGLDLKVVYLPHPARVERIHPDFVDDEQLRHVVVESTVRDDYRASWKWVDHGWRARNKTARTIPLPLDHYPALLENAEFVICPLSTMMLEAAIYRRQVLVIAYHDGLHRTSPYYTMKYLHFEGVDRVNNFHVCRREKDLPHAFSELADSDLPPRRPPKEQMDYWIYHDEKPFAERLGAFAEDIVREWSKSAGAVEGVLLGSGAESSAEPGHTASR